MESTKITSHGEKENKVMFQRQHNCQQYAMHGRHSSTQLVHGTSDPERRVSDAR